MSSQFSASAPTLGYIYQIRYALYLILREQEHEAGLSIERLDDVAFEKDGTPYELLQLKHHLNKQASLTDRSPDLWKTIRIWSTEADINRLISSELILTLVTTAKASEDSIAYLLSPVTQQRNLTLALQKLREIAKNPGNTELKSSYDAFLALNETKQKALVKSIYILDQSPSIEKLPEKIMRLLLGIRPEHRQSAFEQIEAWWFKKVIEHLIDNTSSTILSRTEIAYKIADIADQYGPEALPIHFRDVNPPIPDNAESKMFVEQLRQIAITEKMITQAILDYYRAYEQRSRWARRDLLIDDEIEKYETRLIEEWEIVTQLYIDDLGENATEEELRQYGRKILNHIYTQLNIPIRKKVTDPYVMRGSYQILADNIYTPIPKVWWHPKFIERLEQILV